MAFEEEFNVEIPDEAAEKIKTVQDVVNYIDQKQVMDLRPRCGTAPYRSFWEIP